MPTLFDPIKIGALSLPNRILMSPLTRCRASAGRVSNALMADYYRQRASAGLIFSEATSVTPMGVGYPRHARHLVRSTGRRLETDHQSHAWRGWPHLVAAVACRSHFASVFP